MISRLILLAVCVMTCACSFAREPAQVAETHSHSPTTQHAQDLLVHAMTLIGVHYRRGGESPEKGFDCSGFVRHVFRETVGLILPHNAKDISRFGDKVSEEEIQPGDLVFFNTLRRSFSHVGIYLGNHRFIHAPASGGTVRVEDMRQRYWSKRFNGARRMLENTDLSSQADLDSEVPSIASHQKQDE